MGGRWPTSGRGNPGGSLTSAKKGSSSSRRRVRRSERAYRSFPNTAALSAKKPSRTAAWPATLPEQVRAVRGVLLTTAAPTTAAAVARLFAGRRETQVGELLETLTLLGQSRQLPDGRFVGQF